MTSAEQLKAIRASAGLSQAKFSEKFDIPRRTLEAWEAGERKPPQYVVSLLAAAVENLQRQKEL